MPSSFTILPTIALAGLKAKRTSSPGRPARVQFDFFLLCSFTSTKAEANMLHAAQTFRGCSTGAQYPQVPGLFGYLDNRAHRQRNRAAGGRYHAPIARLFELWLSGILSASRHAVVGRHESGGI